MRLLQRRHSEKRTKRRGAVTVEMALITPVLFTLLFGILQVGYAFVVQHGLQQTAREACRTATLRIRSNTETNSTVTSQLQSFGIDPTKTTTTILVNNVTQDVASANAGDDVRVTISMPLADATLFPGFFSNYSGTMRAAVTLRCE